MSSVLKKFRNGDKVLPIEAVCKKYKIKRNDLFELIKNEVISYFQLISEKGSKFLFLQSDLDNENEIFMEYRKRNLMYNRNVVSSKSGELLKVIINESAFNIPQREKAFLNRYLVERNTLDSIGVEFGLTKERSRQIFEMGCSILLKEVRKQRENEDYKKKYEEINAKYKELLSTVGRNELPVLSVDESEIAIERDRLANIFSKKLVDEDLSVRFLNICYNYFYTIGDLVRNGKNITKKRGCGKKTFAEAENLLNKYGLRFGMKIPQVV